MSSGAPRVVTDVYGTASRSGIGYRDCGFELARVRLQLQASLTSPAWNGSAGAA